MTDSVRKDLMEMNVDSVIIPGGCTQNILKHQMYVGMSHLKQGWPNCMINGLVKVSINLLKVEIWQILPGKNNWVGVWRLTSTVQFVEELWFEPCNWCYRGWLYPLFKKETALRAGRQKLNSQLSILVDKSDVVNPYISPSDEEDANKEMNVIEDETEI